MVKVSEFVQRVSPALHQQVASMGDNGEELCTAQDVVGYVSQLILSEISHKPPPPPLVARVADKTAMLAEVCTHQLFNVLRIHRVINRLLKTVAIDIFYFRRFDLCFIIFYFLKCLLMVFNNN